MIAPPLSLSDSYQILTSSYRRQLLFYLQRKDADVADLDELVVHIHEESDEARTAEQIRLSLTQTSIPKLVDCGVIEYDRQNKDVRYRNRTKLGVLLTVVPTNAQSA